MQRDHHPSGKAQPAKRIDTGAELFTYVMETTNEARLSSSAREGYERNWRLPGFDVERLLDDLELDLLWEDMDDNPEGEVLGQLVPDQKLVVLNERHHTRLEQNDGRQRRYTIGHEVGPWTLHSEAARATSSNAPRPPGLGSR